MASDPRDALAAAALIHADPDTAAELGLLWAKHLLAGADPIVPVYTRVRLDTADLKQLVRTHPAALRLADGSDQLLGALPATRQVTQEHATYALSHVACDDRVRDLLAPRVAGWRMFSRPVGAEAAARSWVKGGVNLTMPHVAASKTEGLAWALHEPQSSAALRKHLEYGDTLWLVPQLGLRARAVEWPPVNDIRAPWLAAALLADALIPPTAAKRRALVRGLHQGTIVPDLRDKLVQLVEADDPDSAVLDQAYESGTPSNMRDAWRLGWGHCAARAALAHLGADVAAWRAMFQLLPTWQGTLGELLDVATDVVAAEGR